MRCFIAIELDNDYFRELQNNIKEHIKGTFPKTFHLTLKFLGEVEDDAVNNIKETLSNIKFESFKISLSKIGRFPNENYIRVIWIGLEPKEKIIELQKKIDNELLRLGFKKEKEFEPHLTLARVKFIKDKIKFNEFIKNIKVEKLEFDFDNFKLIKSTLTRNGAVYEEIEKYS